MMKRRIITVFTAICIAFAITGCSQSTWLYRVNIQQGNIVTSDMVHQLHAGMTKEAVCELLGPPLLTDAFNENRWTYTYTFKPSRGKYIDRNLVIYFKYNKIFRIATKNMGLSS